MDKYQCSSGFQENGDIFSLMQEPGMGHGVSSTGTIRKKSGLPLPFIPCKNAEIELDDF